MIVWGFLQSSSLIVGGGFGCVPALGAQPTASKKVAPKQPQKGKTVKKQAKKLSAKQPSASTSKTKSRQNKEAAKSAKNINKSKSKKQPSTASTAENNKKLTIEELKSSIKKTNQDRHDLQVELKKSEKQIREVRGNIKELQKKREKVEAQLRKQQKESIRLEAELSHEQKVLEEINRQRMQELSLKGAPTWSSDAYRSERTEIMLGLLAQKSKESIKKLDKKQRELAVVLAKAKKNQTILKNTVDKEKLEQERLRKERLERQRTVAKLDRELLVKETTLKKLQEDEKRLGTLVAKIQKQEKSRPKESEKKIEKNRKEIPSYGKVNPVDGQVVAKFGEKRKGSKDLGTWKGTVFSVTEEKPVRAVRTGKVVFSDYLRGYGNLMIIEHKDGYYSVYGNNSRLEKDIGDNVKQGEEISKVGAKGSDISVLYFEVRHKGKPIDPAGWLNI